MHSTHQNGTVLAACRPYSCPSTSRRSLARAPVVGSRHRISVSVQSDDGVHHRTPVAEPNVSLWVDLRETLPSPG